MTGRTLPGIVATLLLWCGGCDSPPVDGAGRDAAAAPTPVRISVSESALPLVELLTGEAMRLDPTQRLIVLPPSHSPGALAAVRTGESDIAVVTRGLSPEELEGLQYLHMARDGLVFATHRGVRVRDLGRDQILGIYSGRVTNWSEVGGPDREIVVLDRPEHTSPKIVLRDLLFGERFEITPGAVVLERPSMMNVSLGTLEGSIGYGSLGEILTGGLDINVLSLDGIAPTPQNVEDSLYPLARFIGMAIRPRPTRDLMRFVGFVYRDDALNVMRDSGYSPMLMNLVIATIPETNVIRQDERYGPLVDYLSDRLGPRTRIRLRHLARYEDLVDEFMSGSVNAAFFGSFTYVHAHARVGVEPIARPEKNGNSSYRGLILTRKDSGIVRWSDLRGKSFSLIRDTTAGDIFPRVFLGRHGVSDPGSFFGEMLYTGSHDASILKVLQGEADAGAAKDLVFRRLVEEDPRIGEELIVLAESPAVPENALVVRANVTTACITCHEKMAAADGGIARPSLSFTESLRRELLALEESAEGRAVLDAFGADRFLETTDADYANLYEMIEELGLDLSRYRN